MDIKYQMFVSSTYEDLIEERKEVTQAILECNCFPSGMELFPASNRSQWEIIKRVIDGCDFYLVIIAGRYGSIGIDDDGKKVGYTEMEFDYAIKTNKPILALIYDNIDNLPRSKSETSKAKQSKLLRFREKACCGRVIKKWNNKDNLKAAALTAIIELTKDTNAVGWIKADFKMDKASYIIFEEQREAYEKRLAELNEKFEQANMVIIEKDKSIAQLQNYVACYKEEIKKLTDKNNSLLQNQDDKGNFWILLAEINARYEYFRGGNDRLVKDLSEECSRELSNAEYYFLRYTSDGYRWKLITEKAFALEDTYKRMQNDQKCKYLNSLKLSFEEYVPDKDCLALSNENFDALFSMCFFLIFATASNKIDELQSILALKRRQIIAVCDEFVSELWEIELALRENDD